MLKFLYRKIYLLFSFIRYFINILFTNKFSKTSYAPWVSFEFIIFKKKHTLISNLYDLRTYFVHKNLQKYKIEYLVSFQLKNKYEIFYDIGANIGEFTVPLANHFDQVVAFEPNPIIYSCLLENVKNYENCVCYNHAISDYEGATLLKIRPISSGGDSLKEINNFNQEYDKFYFPPQYLIKTDVFKISNLLIKSKNYEKNLVIKIDTEGCEYNILIDFYENILMKKFFKKNILIMFENNAKTNIQFDFNELIKKYLKAGFFCYAIFNNKDYNTEINCENLNFLTGKNCEVVIRNDLKKLH
ncbi:Methyltransferase FkbM [Candidatus Pelagibacterales bacterium]